MHGVSGERAMNKHTFRAILDIALALANVAISIAMVSLLPKEQAIWGVTIGTVFSVICGNWITLNIYNKRVIGLPMGKYFMNLLIYISFMIAGVAISYGITLLFTNRFELSNFIKFLVSGGSFVFVYCILLFVFQRKSVLELLRKIPI